MKLLRGITLIASAVCALEVSAAVDGQWTGWLNRDRPSGSGDYELLANFLKERPQALCEIPSAIEARVLRGDGQIFTPQSPPAENIRVFNPDKGLACINSDQKDGTCDDYEVRFLCAPPTIASLSLPVARTDLLQLREPQREGNGIALVTLDREQLRNEPPKEFSIDNDDVITVVNDMGEGADALAGDFVFSGFVNIDEKAVTTTNEVMVERIKLANAAANNELIVREFSGRTVAGSSSFPVKQTRALLPAKDLPLKFEAFAIPLPFPTTTPPPLVQPENALVINDPSVVAHPAATYDPCNTDGTNNNTNPDALYSFKTLISNLNDETQPGNPTDQEFVHEWLRNWMQNTSANGFTIPARTGVQDYFPGWDGLNASTLDLDALPFRLLAIVNRIDLASVAAYGNSNPNKPGEIRFLYGLLDIDHNTGVCNGIATFPNEMTTIFEYRDATNSCSSLKNLANDWIDLDTSVINGTTPLGSATFMADLKVITDTVTVQGANKLNQLRTNDFAFDGKGSLAGQWQLREFVMASGTSNLEPATIKQTPDFNAFRGFTAPGMGTLADYVLLSADEPNKELLCDAHSVPEIFNGIGFLGSHVNYLPNTSWPVNFGAASVPAPIAPPSCYSPSYIPGTDAGLPLNTVMQIEMRHKLSLNACDDCHAAETATFFTHISPVTRNLSGFMTGVTVTDPTPSPIQREFNDIARRNQAMSGIAGAFCGFGGPILINSFQAQQARLNMVH